MTNTAAITKISGFENNFTQNYRATEIKNKDNALPSSDNFGAFGKVSAPQKPTALTEHQTKLAFQVDEENKKFFVLIKDADSGKVLRTIPPEAIKQLPPGELFQYSI